MNCKPGDLAVVVNGPNIGGLCRVVSPYTVRMVEGLCWNIECLSRMRDNLTGNPVAPGTAALCADAFLRPIRDPGDDAVDETLQWLPVPREDELSREDAVLLLDALHDWARTA
jgi:hypothetical protein